MRTLAFMVGLVVITLVFNTHSWVYYLLCAILYSVTRPFGGKKKSSRSPLPGAPNPTPPPLPSIPLSAPNPPQPASPLPFPVTLEAQITPSRAWFDPRVWAWLVRAYALFLILATIGEYGKLSRFVLAAQIPTPREAEQAGVFLQAELIGLFVLPFLLSQTVLAVWLILVTRPGLPTSSMKQAVQIATEVLGVHRKGYRKPWILIGAVAQPVMVSLFAKPLLLLPRQGLAYFQHYLDDDAEEAFRSVVAHELGHLESWDDMLFLPWFSYAMCSVALWFWGVILILESQLNVFELLAHLLLLGALLQLGLYVMRRREAYSDAYGVVTMESTKGIELALSALGRERESAWGARTNIHFDVQRRIRILAERGRTFMNMSRADIGIVAFMYFGLDTKPLSELGHGGDVVFVGSIWIDSLAQFALLFLLMLMFGGFILAREGKLPRSRELAPAALTCLVGLQLYDFFSGGIFNLLHLGMFLMQAVVKSIVGVPFFIFGVRAVCRWMLGILLPNRSNSAERLAWGVLIVVAPFTLVSTILDLVLSRSAGGFTRFGFQGVVDLANSPQSEFVAMLLPIMLVVAAIWTVRLCFGLAVVFLGWRTTRKVPDVECRGCGRKCMMGDSLQPLLVECPQCHTILRPDLAFELGGGISA